MSTCYWQYLDVYIFTERFMTLDPYCSYECQVIVIGHETLQKNKIHFGIHRRCDKYFLVDLYTSNHMTTFVCLVS